MLQMGRRDRIHYTEADKALMWERWRQGESLHAIGQLFDRHHTTVRGMLARTGGIRPPPRRRSRLALTLAKREEISRGLMAGLSVRTIAAALGRAVSTVRREIDRNDGREAYRASTADEAAWDRAIPATTPDCPASSFITITYSSAPQDLARMARHWITKGRGRSSC
jgi:IS30 family transposase